MNFLSPAFLFGLPLVAVPVLIHLLSRRQQKRISWGAMRFLQQAATRRRRLWRLTDVLLLILRTAAFLFFIFALARPLVPAAWLGGLVPREVILVLDQSLSMARRSDGASAFERLIQRGTALLDDLHPSDTVRVLLAGETPAWLLPEPLAASGAALATVRARIQALRPTLGGGDLLASIREAVDLEPARDKAGRRIIVISDGQRFGWRLDEQPAWTSILSRIAGAAVPITVDLEWVGDPAPAPNLCVNHIETPRSHGAVNQTLTFTASIQNHGSEPSGATLLAWRVNDEDAGVSTVPDLAPGAVASVSMAHAFPGTGTFDVTGTIEANDALSDDNLAHRLVDIHDRLPVLVVEDPVAGEPLGNDSSFVLAALGARPNAGVRAWHSVFQPTVVDSSHFESTELNDYTSVMILNPRALSKSIVDRLEAYARTGGGVWLALGDRTDVEAFNAAVYRGGQGLSPLRLLPPVGDPEDRTRYFSVRAASEAHPATALLSDFERLDLDRARLYRRFPFDVGSGRDISVLLQAQGGEPAVIERKLGAGRILVQAFPLGVAWSSLPLCQAYVAMIHEWLWYLSEPVLPHRNLGMGDALVESASGAKAPAGLVLPDAQKIDVTASGSLRGPVFRYVVTRLPGEYRLEIPGGDTPRHARFHVEREARESDLTPLTEEDHRQLASLEGSADDPSRAATSAGPPKSPPHPLEGWLLGALPLVLLGEMALAGWTSHRRSLRVSPVTMDA